MQPPFNLQIISELQEKLNHHPIYSALHNLEDLRRFMTHHIFSVWDFMSLVKYLQSKLVPASVPWRPQSSPTIRRFINSLVLEEESDEGPPSVTGEVGYSSHFELYCQAMREIGADPQPALHFVEIATRQGIDLALQSEFVPEPSRVFTQATFDFIATDKPHIVAAALALGRERVIPDMFRALLANMAITEADAPAFHYYLRRHIHLDEDFHAPQSLQLLNELCGGEEKRIKEAEEAAKQAILVRLLFWNQVLHSIKLVPK
jgi:hypothetical protein